MVVLVTPVLFVVFDLGHNVYGTVHFRFGVGDAHGRADEGNGNKTR